MALVVTDAQKLVLDAIESYLHQAFLEGVQGETNGLAVPSMAGYDHPTMTANGGGNQIGVRVPFRSLAAAILKATTVDSGGGGGPAVNNTTFTGTCTVTELVGDVVRISAAGKAVSKADPAAFATLPGVGIIISKTGDTACTVQIAGFITNLYTTLVPGKTYFVGADGRPTDVPPSSPNFVQGIGLAIDTNVLAVFPSLHIARGA